MTTEQLQEIAHWYYQLGWINAIQTMAAQPKPHLFTYN